MAGYTGDVDASTTWEHLNKIKTSVLVDVRTTAEWTFVGVPDLSTINKTVILQEWQQYPEMNINSHFAENIAAAIRKQGGDENTEVYFLCRSGVRSMSAASELTSLGFTNCFNVTGGFEGPPDDERHRGRIDGWKALNLPWTQN